MAIPGLQSYMGNYDFYWRTSQRSSSFCFPNYYSSDYYIPFSYDRFSFTPSQYRRDFYNPDRYNFAKYSFKNRKLKINVMEFGDLVNTVAPVHIKQGGLAHNIIAKFVKMDGEEESYESYGDVLMYGGVSLKPAFSGTGYSDEVRFFRDFASRIYFMVQESKA